MKKVLFAVLAASAVFALAGCKEKKNVVINSKADLENLSIGCQAGTTGRFAKRKMQFFQKCNRRFAFS